MGHSLAQFVTANRDELVSRCRAKVAGRSSAATTTAQTDDSVPLFLDPLIAELDGRSQTDAITEGAGAHGRNLREQGFTIGQVVHDYGDVRQSTTDLAVERNAPISTDDFRTLNRCLDNAIAGAVTLFTKGSLTATSGTFAEMERSSRPRPPRSRCCRPAPSEWPAGPAPWSTSACAASTRSWMPTAAGRSPWC